MRLWLLACLMAPAGAAGAALQSETLEKPFVRSVSINVADLAASKTFFMKSLEFESLGRFLQAGSELVELQAHPEGRRLPADSRSNDLWFQHLAIVVSDMERAWARLSLAGVRPVSVGGPQTIPQSNPAAGGIRACYFRDADGHNLEIIWYPRGKGQARWQNASGKLVLGIDHTAIAVSDTARSVKFYREILGLEVAGESLNFGPEQEALSGVPGARVRITGLRGSGGPGIELLEYLEPRTGRPFPPEVRPTDLLRWEIVLQARRLAPLESSLRAAGVAVLAVGPKALRVRDPDGHALQLVEQQ
jgi:catechol 2,3-dioxygenase-like lactoylglutathione lyase family enzyme